MLCLARQLKRNEYDGFLRQVKPAVFAAEIPMETIGLSHCPLLGIPFDPATHFLYPTEENACGSLRGPEPLDLRHQAQFCLSENYAVCPYFEANPQTTRWNKMAQSGGVASPQRRVSWLSLVGIVVVSAALLVMVGFLLTSGQPVASFFPARGSPTLFVPPMTPTPSPTFKAVTYPPPFVRLSQTPTASPTQITLASLTKSPRQTTTPTVQSRRPPSPDAAGTAVAAARTPPPSNPEYIAPRLLSPAYNEALREELEILRWQPGTDTSGAIKVYAVEVWKEGTKPIGAGWTRDSSFELNAIANPDLGDGS